jgi:hypothetical protein
LPVLVASRAQVYADAVKGLVAIASLLLVLSAAGTVHLVYTIRPSYALLGIACLAGVVLVAEGWRSLPASLRWSAGLLLAVHVVALIFSHPEVLPGESRAGHLRGVLYLSDLVLGLAVVCLVCRLWRGVPAMQRLLLALVAGGTICGLYALYQWPAQRFGWPLRNLNNTIDSNGVTIGGSQGVGIFGI